MHMRFHPDLTGTGPLVTDLATDLVEQGNEVTVVTSMPHYGRHDLPEEYRGRLLHRSNFNGVDLWRTFVYVPANPSGFQRAVNYLSYTLMSVVGGLMAEKPDVILCVNPPITVGFSGWLLGLLRRAPLVFNVQDVWPDCLVIIDQLRSPLLIRIFKRLEKFIYRVSARVTVLSEGMKENLVRKGVPAGKVVVIPNWANVEAIRPVERENSFREAHGLNGHFVVMFAGNLGFIAMLERVIDAARLLEDEPRIRFLIVGEGNAKPGLLGRASELGLKNVRFLSTQPKEVLPEMLGAADLSLVTLNRHLGQLNVPSKTYSIMASARPVLASVPEDSEIARLVEAADCGMGVPPEDPHSLAQAIRDLSHRPEKLDHYGANGRRYVEEYLDRRKLTAQYHKLLHQIVEQKGMLRGVIPEHSEPALKRPLDILLSLFMLLVTLPLSILAALAIKLGDGGPVFYRQERWGRGGTKFTVFKFRTMIPDADRKFGMEQARVNDQRILRVGRILRACGFDELPQIINILWGEMSFVGPRALAVGEIVYNEEGQRVDYEKIPGFFDRLAARPGLTSLATIYLPKDCPARRKFRYDRYYVRKQSFGLDLRLIVLSFQISFRGKWETRQKKM